MQRLVPMINDVQPAPLPYSSPFNSLTPPPTMNIETKSMNINPMMIPGIMSLQSAGHEHKHKHKHLKQWIIICAIIAVAVLVYLQSQK